jgi:hypothetical protein
MRSTQSDKNLDFNGMTGDGVNRGKSRFAGNQHSGVTNPAQLINKGRGPTKGNQDYDVNQGAHREPPYSSRSTVEFPKNVDKINNGTQFRGYGTKEVKFPTNADKQNVGRGPTKGNQQ